MVVSWSLKLLSSLVSLVAILKHLAFITRDKSRDGKKVTSAVHSKGGVIFLQLWHMGRVRSKCLNPNQEQIVSASDIRFPGKTMQGGDYEVPHALTVDEIKSIVGEYAQAAKNAIEARFDGVEIHGANGYLVDQFLNSSSNNRTDVYGGSVENRSLFALEVVDAVAEAVGEEHTAIRLSPGGAFQGMAIENVEENWSHLTHKRKTQRISWKATENSGKGPFILAGGFSISLEFGNEIAKKTGDLFSYGCAFISNPDLPERLRNGWELNPYDRNTFYSHEAEGYTDYPFYNEKK